MVRQYSTKTKNAQEAHEAIRPARQGDEDPPDEHGPAAGGVLSVRA